MPTATDDADADVIVVGAGLSGLVCATRLVAGVKELNDRVDSVKKHVGIYAFRHDVLRRFATWPPSALERTESLEQLRFLENGVKIRMSEGEGSLMAVDTPEQAEEVRRILRTEGI